MVNKTNSCVPERAVCAKFIQLIAISGTLGNLKHVNKKPHRLWRRNRLLLLVFKTKMGRLQSICCFPLAPSLQMSPQKVVTTCSRVYPGSQRLTDKVSVTSSVSSGARLGNAWTTENQHSCLLWAHTSQRFSLSSSLKKGKGRSKTIAAPLQWTH